MSAKKPSKKELALRRLQALWALLAQRRRIQKGK